MDVPGQVGSRWDWLRLLGLCLLARLLLLCWRFPRILSVLRIKQVQVSVGLSTIAVRQSVVLNLGYVLRGLGIGGSRLLALNPVWLILLLTLQPIHQVGIVLQYGRVGLGSC